MSKKEKPVSMPIGIGTVSIATIRRVTVNNHVALRAAVLATLRAWGYEIVSTQPSSIGGLETITAERYAGMAESNWPNATAFQENLAAACRKVQDQMQADRNINATKEN